MRRAPRAILSILATVPFLVGVPAMAQSPTPVPVLDVEWTLTQLDGEAVPADPAITATFATSGTLTGSGGCNTYSATWTSDGTNLTVSDLLATFAACSEDVDARESSYFTLLQDAATWSLDGSAITVTTASGSTLVYGGDDAGPTGLQLVGSWPLATIDGEAPPPGLSVTLDIGADGSLGGEACNVYSASYTANEAGDLSIDAIAATRKSCGDAADAFETTYFDALQGASQWGTQDGQLFLSGVSDLVFGESGVTDVTLTGQEWTLTNLGGAPIAPGSGVTATFGDDGSVTGSGGCNRYMGPFTVDGESLAIGPLAATRMSCGVTTDDLESTFLGALEAASGFAISGTDLVISTTNDVTLEFSAAAGPVEPIETPFATEEPTATDVPEPSAAASDGDIVGSWKMTSYVGSVLPGNMLAIDITFSDDGTFSGFGGCNDYSGQWALDGSKLTISGFESASSGTCDQMTQGLETGYFSLLPFLDTAEVAADGTLSLESALAGGQGFVYEPAG
jgi:heat shock protein HslJ